MPWALEGGGDSTGWGWGFGHNLLRLCFAHSLRIGDGELQTHKSLKSLLQSSWAIGTESPGHLKKAVSLLEGRLGVPRSAEQGCVSHSLG